MSFTERLLFAVPDTLALTSGTTGEMGFKHNSINMGPNGNYQLQYLDYRRVPRRAETRRGRNVTGITASFIGGGDSNTINPSSDCSFISGGSGNNIGALTGAGFGVIFGGIGGGGGNCIDDTSAPTSYGIIGGGQANCICAGTNHSSIFSGNGNIVSGSCSSILGGSGNSDGGFNYVGIFGQAITGVGNNLFHVDGIYVNAMCGPGPGGLVPGTLYYQTGVLPGPLAACKVIFMA